MTYLGGVRGRRKLLILYQEARLFPSFKFRYIWDKVFKSGPSKICERQPLKSLKGHGLLKQTISLQTFWRSCLPQILLGPLLNTLTHLYIVKGSKFRHSFSAKIVLSISRVKKGIFMWFFFIVCHKLCFRVSIIWTFLNTISK